MSRSLNLALCLSILAGLAGAQGVYVQEFCADPADAVIIDTNGDGVLNSSEDEFIELVNAGASNVDISNWTVSDAVGVRHTFPSGTSLDAGCSIVVFGGGSVTAFNALGAATGVVADTGFLGLNNTGDDIVIADASAAIVEMFTYTTGGNGFSVTRVPEAPGGVFIDSPTASGLDHTAGFLNDGLTAYCAASLAGPTYPGNGSDLSLDVDVNGTPDSPLDDVHTVTAGDNLAFNMSSPLGSNIGQPFILAFFVGLTGIPAPPITLPGDPAPAVHITVVLAQLLVDGFTTQGQLFAPVIQPGGFNYGPITIPAFLSGTGNSVWFQLFCIDPGINGVNIGTDDAHQFIVI